MSLRETCEEFVGIDISALELKEVFSRVASLVIGVPFFASHPGGKRFYRRADSVRVLDVLPGYFLSYSSFLRYANLGSEDDKFAKRAWSVPDMIRPSERVTGVIPVASCGLSRAVVAYLSRGPWLDALCWHSVSRHAMPPRDAALRVMEAGAAKCSHAASREKIHSALSCVVRRRR